MKNAQPRWGWACLALDAKASGLFASIPYLAGKPSRADQAGPYCHRLPPRTGGWAAQLDGGTLRRLLATHDSLSAIARTVGCDHGTVIDALLRHGLQGLEVAEGTAARLRALYEDEGLSVRGVADRLGVDAKTVRRWLRSAGIPLRARGRPRR